jgi:hypothetical protein
MQNGSAPIAVIIGGGAQERQLKAGGVAFHNVGESCGWRIHPYFFVWWACSLLP